MIPIMVTPEIINAHMAALLRKTGSQDAVCALHASRFGRTPAQGSYSRKLSGTASWSILDATLFQEVHNTTVISDLMAEDVDLDGPDGASPIELCSEIARECGEAQAAFLNAMSSVVRGDRARAIVEMQEAVAILTRGIAFLNGGQSI